MSFNNGAGDDRGGQTSAWAGVAVAGGAGEALDGHINAWAGAEADAADKTHYGELEGSRVSFGDCTEATVNFQVAAIPLGTPATKVHSDNGDEYQERALDVVLNTNHGGRLVGDYEGKDALETLPGTDRQTPIHGVDSTKNLSGPRWRSYGALVDVSLSGRTVSIPVNTSLVETGTQIRLSP